MSRARPIHKLAAVLLGLTMPACGTLVGGTTQIVQTGSNPQGATVTTNPPTTQYTTPASIALERKNAYTLTFVSPGYSKEDFLIAKQMRAGVLIADIILFPIGVIVDAITGAWYKLTPSPVTVQLRKLTSDIEGPDTIDVTIRASDDGKGLLLESSQPVTVTVRDQG
jgi:hypothetical protein